MTDTIHICVAMKPIEGNFAQNAQEYGVAGLNIDGCRIETEENLNGGAYAENPTHREGQDMWTSERKGDINCFKRGGAGEYEPPKGRFPANIIHDGSEEVVVEFPDSKGMSGGGTRRQKSEIMPSIQVRESSEHSHLYRGDNGSAARFFKECKPND